MVLAVQFGNSFHFPELIANPMNGLDAFSFGGLGQFFSILCSPPERQRSLVGHVSNPYQIALLDRGFSTVNASNHAIGPVHQKRNGSVVNFDPLEGVHVLKETSEREENTPFLFLILDFDHQRDPFHEHHGPRSIFGHFKKPSIHVQVDVEVRLKLF